MTDQQLSDEWNHVMGGTPTAPRRHGGEPEMIMRSARLRGLEQGRP